MVLLAAPEVSGAAAGQRRHPGARRGRVAAGAAGALEAQTLPRDAFEVVVVDNASRDATAAVARAAGAVVVHEPHANRSRARNRGIAAARAPLLAFTDADCTVSSRLAGGARRLRGDLAARRPGRS